MYIEANVSEINIGKVAVGNKVEVEFDAYPGETFMGEITFIDPGETIVDEVVNYKIRIGLDIAGDSEQANRIKSGLTAAVKIASAKKEGVLTIPLYSILRENGKLYVNKLLDEKGTIEKVEVMTGITGSDGKTEVVSGLSEGDRVEVSQ